jgi:hypothetical protein
MEDRENYCKRTRGTCLKPIGHSRAMIKNQRKSYARSFHESASAMASKKNHHAIRINVNSRNLERMNKEKEKNLHKG